MTPLSSVRRPADYEERDGGEEFAVDLLGTDDVGNLAVAANTQRAVRALDSEYPGREWGFATVRLSVASMRAAASGRDADTLLREADRGLPRQERKAATLAFVATATSSRRRRGAAPQDGRHAANARTWTGLRG